MEIRPYTFLPCRSWGIIFLLKIIPSLLISVACWEVFLTNFVISLTGKREHSVIGNISSQKTGVYFQAIEGRCCTRINSLGLRGPEIPPKDPAIFRVLILGDSYTEAFQVSDESTFCSIAQSHANRLLGTRVEVVNAGRGGINPAYYVHLAPIYQKLFASDLTVVQVNDDDFYFEILQRGGYYVERHGSEFRTSENLAFTPQWPLLKRFPQLDLQGRFRELSVVRLIGRSMFRFMPSEVSVEDQICRLDAIVHSEHEAATEWTVHALKERYGHIVMLHIPVIGLHDGGVPIHKMERNLARYARDAGLDLISFREEFVRAQRQERLAVRGFSNTAPGQGHLNEYGHAIVGHRLAEYIVTHFNPSTQSKQQGH